MDSVASSWCQSCSPRRTWRLQEGSEKAPRAAPACVVGASPHGARPSLARELRLALVREAEPQLRLGRRRLQRCRGASEAGRTCSGRSGDMGGGRFGRLRSSPPHDTDPEESSMRVAVECA